MKYAIYKLAGSIPELLVGKEIKTREAENLEEFRQLVEGGKDENILRLAQGAFDIIDQRKVREFCESEEVAQALAGKTVKWAEDDEVEYGAYGEAERVEDILSRAQDVAHAYVYGSRPAGTGAGKAVKAKAQQLDVAVAAAKSDPELAAKLAALGIQI